MVRELRYILAVLIGVSMMSSCADEPLVSGYGDIPEGHATVSAKVSFKPFGSALNGDSRTEGDAIKEIQSLYVVLFDANGKHIKTFNAKEQAGYEEKSESRNDVSSGATDEHIAENQTPCATFKTTIPYGKYKIYVVANHELDDEKVYTIEELRSINLTWDTSMGMNKNNQMFGYFTNGKTETKPTGWEAPEVTIASPSVDLHAWIRRAASKVTVAYDGSELNDNVYITIKSVQIKDISKNCKLGVDYGVENKEGLIENGEIIEYATSGNNGPVITAGGVTWGATYIEKGNWDEPYDPKGENGKAHTETSEALFFYENLQGTGDTKKQEDTDKDGLVDGQEEKDNKPNGTYIEVKAYYVNNNPKDVSQGDIVYRFMLGKDTDRDYNAERNYHYKLTLKFRGNANDVDWHIAYNEEPGIYVPDVYYISYLYGETMQMPLKVVIDNDDVITNLNAIIEENNWEPDADPNTLNSIYYGSAFKTFDAYGPNGVVTGNIGEPNTKVPWVGFLSLRDEVALNGGSILKNPATVDNISEYVVSKEPYNWYTMPNGNSDNHLGQNGGYVGIPGPESSSTKSVLYNIDFFTRLKQLYIVSGFTGNNPYVGYERTAKVKFIVKTKKHPDPEKELEENGFSDFIKPVKIVQVRRLVNPTGIWRDKDNTKPFNVVLQEQMGYGGGFNDLISQGPWSVDVLEGNDDSWFTISPKSGPTGSKVAFTYTPVSATSTPRYAILKVKYHNETCNHLIFLRQGYEPIAIEDGGAEWYSFNLKTKDKMTTSPLDEGSLYRYGKWEYPISEKNNVRPDATIGVPLLDNTYLIMENDGGGGDYKWSDIGSVARGSAISSPIGATTLPTEEDWKVLQALKQGYGVLYADGASEVAKSSTTDAFGYRDAYTQSNPGIGEKRGMRGVFAYNEKTGAHVFFPIGAVGHGHRKQEHAGGDYGILRYGTVNDYLSNVNNTHWMYRPMLYGLFQQYGAIYWTSTNGHGWDINFDQLDFNTYTYTNAWTGGTDSNSQLSDACFVRLVKYRE